MLCNVCNIIIVMLCRKFIVALEIYPRGKNLSSLRIVRMYKYTCAYLSNIDYILHGHMMNNFDQYYPILYELYI